MKALLNILHQDNIQVVLENMYLVYVRGLM